MIKPGAFVKGFFKDKWGKKFLLFTGHLTMHEILNGNIPLILRNP